MYPFSTDPTQCFINETPGLSQNIELVPSSSDAVDPISLPKALWNVWSAQRVMTTSKHRGISRIILKNMIEINIHMFIWPKMHLGYQSPKLHFKFLFGGTEKRAISNFQHFLGSTSRWNLQAVMGSTQAWLRPFWPSVRSNQRKVPLWSPVERLDDE